MITVVDGTMGSLFKEITALKTRVDTVCNKLDDISKSQKDFIDRFARLEERVSFLEDFRVVVKNIETSLNMCVTEDDLKDIVNEQDKIKRDVTILKEFKKRIEDKINLDAVFKSNFKIALISAIAGACAALGIDLFRLVLIRVMGG